MTEHEIVKMEHIAVCEVDWWSGAVSSAIVPCPMSHICPTSVGSISVHDSRIEDSLPAPPDGLRCRIMPVPKFKFLAAMGEFTLDPYMDLVVWSPGVF